MLNHLSLGVVDLAKSARFYDAALGPLGYVSVDKSASTIGYGLEGQEDQLRLFGAETISKPALTKFHLAFTAPTLESVDLFHRDALGHGGTDAGAPGYRPHYGADYYAAFVLDPDGYKLEAKFDASAVPNMLRL